MSFIVRGLVGNPRADSKTLAATRVLVDAIATAIGAPEPEVTDLAVLGGKVLDYADTEVADLRAELTAVNLLVVATPVYKGSYTGLLKSFLDGYGAGALSATYAIPFTIAASPQHALAGPTHLVPLLDELGAGSPLGGLFLPDSVAADPEERDARILAWLEPRLPLLSALKEVSE